MPCGRHSPVQVYLRAVALFNSFHGRWQEAVIRPPFATQNDVVGQELLLRLPGQDKGANTKKRAAQEANDSDGGANGNGGAGGACIPPPYSDNV
jgi:hypothetical protein